MNLKSTQDALRRLWVIHHYSLPSYLAYAPPWSDDNDRASVQTLSDIAADQRQLADRIGKMIGHYGGQPAQGKYPIHFTALHDLSSQFLWLEMLSYQRRTVAAIDKLLPQLPSGSIGQSLAQECLGTAKAHLDSMQEIIDLPESMST